LEAALQRKDFTDWVAAGKVQFQEHPRSHAVMRLIFEVSI
jgi:hypothetical protein